MAACPEALFIIVCRPSCPYDPSWHFSEDFRPLLAWEVRTDDETLLRRISAKAELKPEAPKFRISKPLYKGVLLGAKASLLWRGEDLGAGQWASFSAWPAASHVDKRTGEEGNSCLCALQLPL